MLDISAWPVVSGILSEPDFSHERHRLIFTAVGKLAAQGLPAADPIAVGHCLEQDGKLGAASGVTYLAELARDTATAANIAHHAVSLRRRAVDRQIKAAADNGDYSRLADLLAEHERLEHPASTNIRKKCGIQSLRTILNTIYPDPKWAIEGILPEGLTLLAGPPKVKKSWFALAAAIAVAAGGKALGRIDVEQGRVLYLALEDRECRLQKRAERILVDGGPGPEMLDVVTTWRRLDDGGLADLRQYQPYIDAGELMALFVTKVTDAKKPKEPFIIRRNGWTFELLAMPSPERIEEAHRRQQQDKARQALGKLMDYLKEWSFRPHTRKELEDARTEMGLSRDDIRDAIARGLCEQRLVERVLPKDLQKSGRKTGIYLAEGA